MPGHIRLFPLYVRPFPFDSGHSTPFFHLNLNSMPPPSKIKRNTPCKMHASPHVFCFKILTFLAFFAALSPFVMASFLFEAFGVFSLKCFTISAILGEPSARGALLVSFLNFSASFELTEVR